MKPNRIASLPDWPARMGEDVAASYMGVGLTTFRTRVKERVYPQPMKEVGRQFWSRTQLDRFIAAQFGLPVDAGQGQVASSGTWDNL